MFLTAWNITNWPCVHEDAAHTRDVLANGRQRRPRLLPAFNLDGQRISPPYYQRALRGALVRVSVVMTRWVIGNKLAFSADIAEINILQDPVPLAELQRQRVNVRVRPSFMPDSRSHGW